MWRHVTIGTLGSWLPGDPRGWRSRGHRRHSSGDYKHPPPAGEHRGLYDYSKRLCPQAVTIPRRLRERIARRIIDELEAMDYRAIAVAVCGQHAHVLVELPDNMPQVKRIAGRCKNASSRAVRVEMPGRVWARGGNFERVESRDHWHEAFGYILRHRQQGGWVWCYRHGHPWRT